MLPILLIIQTALPYPFASSGMEAPADLLLTGFPRNSPPGAGAVPGLCHSFLCSQASAGPTLVLTWLSKAAQGLVRHEIHRRGDSPRELVSTQDHVRLRAPQNSASKVPREKEENTETGPPFLHHEKEACEPGAIFSSHSLSQALGRSLREESGIRSVQLALPGIGGSCSKASSFNC